MLLKTNVFYDFEDFRLDLTEKFLLRDEKLVPITPKVYETLCVLVEDAGHLIEKDELMRRIWQDRFVEESNLTFNIKMLRKALGDDAQKPRFIETVPRRGYRFIADVRCVTSKTEIAAQNFGAHESLKPQIAPAYHFTVERRGNVFAVANWQPERMPEAESALHLISPAPRLLFGRCREIAAAENLLRQEAVRLVTLTGVGGSGKTTLARVVAENCAPDFPDGVFFVELAAIFSPELVAAAVAQTLGVKDSGGGSLPESLQNFLRTSRALLVLDNFEQVAPAASLLANLLAVTARLKILVTSRATLRLSRENELMVPPLAVPPLTNSFALSVAEAENYSAVQMFVERARRSIEFRSIC